MRRTDANLSRLFGNALKKGNDEIRTKTKNFAMKIRRGRPKWIQLDNGEDTTKRAAKIPIAARCSGPCLRPAQYLHRNRGPNVRAQCLPSLCALLPYRDHADGDREPSLHFFLKNNRAFCFLCDDRRAFSNIDLVMVYLGYDFRAAVAWFRGHFDHIPTLRGRPAGITHEKTFSRRDSAANWRLLSEPASLRL